MIKPPSSMSSGLISTRMQAIWRCHVIDARFHPYTFPATFCVNNIFPGATRLTPRRHSFAAAPQACKASLSVTKVQNRNFDWNAGVLEGVAIGGAGSALAGYTIVREAG